MNLYDRVSELERQVERLEGVGTSSDDRVARAKEDYLADAAHENAEDVVVAALQILNEEENGE